MFRFTIFLYLVHNVLFHEPSVVKEHFSTFFLSDFCLFCIDLFCTCSNRVPNTSLLTVLPLLLLLPSRRLVDIILKIIMRVMWFAGGFHWMTIKGRRALPTEAPILTLGPHSSYFDAIPVTMTMASIVMKAESKDIPLWGSKWQKELLFASKRVHHVSMWWSGSFSKHLTCFDAAFPVVAAEAWLRSSVGTCHFEITCVCVRARVRTKKYLPKYVVCHRWRPRAVWASLMDWKAIEYVFRPSWNTFKLKQGFTLHICNSPTSCCCSSARVSEAKCSHVSCVLIPVLPNIVMCIPQNFVQLQICFSMDGGSTRPQFSLCKSAFGYCLLSGRVVILCFDHLYEGKKGSSSTQTRYFHIKWTCPVTSYVKFDV